MTVPNHPGASGDYAARVARHVPGLHDMHRMAGLLLAENVAATGHILVLGAGGGLELRAFADLRPGWRFTGVDPSAAMIQQAHQTLGPQDHRVCFVNGYIDDAPEGPFDGAACLLTLHFLPRDQRLRTLRALARRLRPGAPFVVVHHSFPQQGGMQDLWLKRNAAWLMAAGVPPDQAMAGLATMKQRLPALSPTEDEALLRDAGFGDPQLFYAAFTFRGWIAHRETT